MSTSFTNTPAQQSAVIPPVSLPQYSHDVDNVHASAPFATAVPIENHTITLGANEDLGINFLGQFPQVRSVTAARQQLLLGKNLLDWYLDRIVIPGQVEISHIRTSERAHQLLLANRGVEGRQVVLSTSPPTGSPYDGCLYRHILPPGPLGIQFQQVVPGPPSPPYVCILSVTSTSPLAGKLHPQQLLAALELPGESSREHPLEKLQEFEHLPGRALIVQDPPLQSDQPLRQFGVGDSHGIMKSAQDSWKGFQRWARGS